MTSKKTTDAEMKKSRKFTKKIVMGLINDKKKIALMGKLIRIFGILMREDVKLLRALNQYHQIIEDNARWSENNRIFEKVDSEIERIKKNISDIKSGKAFVATGMIHKNWIKTEMGYLKGFVERLENLKKEVGNARRKR